MAVGDPVQGQDRVSSGSAPVALHSVAALHAQSGQRLLAAGGDDGTIRLWDTSTGILFGRPLVSVSPVRALTALEPQNGRELLAAGGDDGTIRLWDTIGGRTLRELLSGPLPVRALAVIDLLDGRTLLASSGDDGTIHRWDLGLGTSVGGPLAPRGERELAPVRALAAFTVPDGQPLLASAGDDGMLYLWDPATGASINSPLSLKAPIRALATFSTPDGRSLLAASSDDDDAVHILDPLAGKSVHTLLPRLERAPYPDRHSVGALATFSAPDGRSLLAAGSDEGVVYVWDPLAGTLIGDSRSERIDGPLNGGLPVRALVAFSAPDGRSLLAAGGDDGVIHLWDPITSSPLGDLSDAPYPAATVAVPERPSTLSGRDASEEVLTSAIRSTRAQSLPDQAATAETPEAEDLDEPETDVIEDEPEADGSEAETAPRAGLYEEVPGDASVGPKTADSAAAESDVAQRLGGGYDADDADSPGRLDALGFNDDVKMLCSVLADKKAKPPLSIGLFGEWGSGKSFFMRLMRQRIQQLALVAHQAEETQQPTRYCSHVVQITFNAWHYMDANLWASLAVEIFNRLATPALPGRALTSAEEERARVAAERERVLKKLDSYQRLMAELTEQRKRAEAERTRVQEELADAARKRESVARDLAAVVARDVAEELDNDEELKGLLKDSATALGMSDLPWPELSGLVRDLYTMSGQIGSIWRLLSKRKGGWAFLLAAIFVIALLVGLALLVSPGSKIPGAASIVVALATIAGLSARIRPIVTSINTGLETAESALRRAEKLEKEAREKQTKEQIELEAELKGIEAQEHSLAVRLADAAAKEAEAKAEEDDLKAGRRLYRFLQERSGSSDYRGHLGLISQLHQDFQRLSDLLELAGEEGEGKTSDEKMPRIDRIVLYIDDLDRCSPGRVVEVLQAIHLLLALPLFVVVVGVDPRWLLRSLQRHYRTMLTGPSRQKAAEELLNWASTPQNYLEKIFQIPFALTPMDASGFARLVNALSAESADEPRPGSTEVSAGGIDDRQSNVEIGAEIDGASIGSPDPGQESHPVSNAVLLGQRESAPELDTQARQPSGPLASSPGREATAAEEPTTARGYLAEEQRIVMEPGAVASPDEAPDPNPAGLTLTGHEIRVIKALGPLLATPREGKRLINIYRMIRSTQAIGGSSRFLDVDTGDGDYVAVLQLLAIVSGFPHLAPAAFTILLREDPAASWLSFVDRLPDATRSRGTRRRDPWSAEWRELQAGLIDIRNKISVPEELRPYVKWAPRAARFSFATGQLLNETLPREGMS
jgi:WD40 repeat protein